MNTSSTLSLLTISSVLFASSLFAQAQPELRIIVEKQPAVQIPTGLDRTYIQSNGAKVDKSNIYASAMNTGDLVSATLVVHRNGHTYLTFPGSAWATGKAGEAKPTPAKATLIAAK